ncbi:MAG: hypothetical protein LBE25_15470 [Arthrobacter sp.]|jgi:hypothetical protein|nr:hypothetical protein [Arthrobacter sp.]
MNARKTKSRVPGRPVARFSNVLEALGTIAMLVWAVFAFVEGRFIIGTILAVGGLAIGWVTLREFSGKGLGRAPQPGDEPR